jgi:hypothetical protein
MRAFTVQISDLLITPQTVAARPAVCAVATKVMQQTTWRQNDIFPFIANGITMESEHSTRNTGFTDLYLSGGEYSLL